MPQVWFLEKTTLPTAWNIRCACRQQDVLLEALAILYAAILKATNGTRYWINTTDISKTGATYIRGGRILRTITRSVVRTVGTARSATGVSTNLRMPLISAPSWKS